ncbi:catalytic protein [Apiospora saccharicola]|uniref:Catalytic protein n=1 Tax=Apiospora saccharicola TaxID=335842 RepID=A0ABR1WF14_9PEZI
MNEIQSWLEVSVLYALTTMLRENSIPEIKAKFDKIVHVRQSFGSIQKYGLVAAYPVSSDGIVLTGFGQDPAVLPYFLLGNNFGRTSTCDVSGWLLRCRQRVWCRNRLLRARSIRSIGSSSRSSGRTACDCGRIVDCGWAIINPERVSGTSLRGYRR